MNNQSYSVTCTQCGQPIINELLSDRSEQRNPCPNCGFTARDCSIHAEPIEITCFITAQVELITYPQNLLKFARNLIDEGQFSIAVVVAHMACEIATERLVSESFKQKDVEYLKEAVYEFLNGYNLANDKIRKLYTALTGDEIQKQPFWEKFKNSAKRRNRIVHEGITVKNVEAEESFQIAEDLVTHIQKSGQS